jgi:glycosyltransferase involved in cell wall biosynthesis
MKKLTIAIPTYNRIQYLERHIEALLPQLSAECHLLIIDNHSNVDVARSLSATLGQYPGLSYKILRNPVNIGGNANVLRCFELCETDWLWVLGDDDLVGPKAITIALRAIEQYPENILLNFCGLGMHREQAVETVGVGDFIKSWDSFSNILFISANIYHAKTIKTRLSYGYHFAYTCAPHLAMVLQALQPTGKAVLLSDRLLDGQCLIPLEESWAPIIVFLGKMLLLELPLSDADRKCLYRKLAPLPRLELLVIYLVKKTRGQGSVQESLFLYDHIVYRLNYYDKCGLVRCKALLYRGLIRWPNLGYWIIGICYKRFKFINYVSKTKLGDIITVDRFSGF